MDSLHTVILAAGKGKRMESDLPKVLVSLKGKPLISYLLHSVEEAGFEQMPVLVIGHGAEDVQSTLGDGYVYALQKEQLGTGHAVQMTEEYLKDKAETILVLYGDHPLLNPETLTRIAVVHENEKAILTMATTEVPDFEEWREAFDGYGRIIRDEEGAIDRIVEKKDATPEELQIKELNPAYFCINAKWLWESLKKLKNNNAQGEYYLTDLVHMAQKIATVSIDPVEALGANTKEQLQLLEQFI